MMMRRRGAPLVRAAATTAVVAGTAGVVRHRQDQRYARQAAEEQAQYDAQYAAGQQAAFAAQQAPVAAPQPTAPPALPEPGLDMEKLKQLGELHTNGVLSDEEFAAAKAKLLGMA